AAGPSAAPRDWRIVTSHSLRSWACQTIITSRPAGRSALPTLANAVLGSLKNIVPNLLMARSKRPGGKRWTCALACSKVTLCSLLVRASLRARSMTGVESPSLTGGTKMLEHKIGTREEWQAARGELAELEAV